MVTQNQSITLCSSCLDPQTKTTHKMGALCQKEGVHTVCHFLAENTSAGYALGTLFLPGHSKEEAISNGL